ncbi:hypothetical protein ABZP36_004722 [Zizania latifolia]
MRESNPIRQTSHHTTATSQPKRTDQDSRTNTQKRSLRVKNPALRSDPKSGRSQESPTARKDQEMGDLCPLSPSLSSLWCFGPALMISNGVGEQQLQQQQQEKRRRWEWNLLEALRGTTE